jgi:hypothetical protein
LLGFTESILTGASSEARCAGGEAGEAALVTEVADLGCGAGRLDSVERGGANDTGKFVCEAGVSVAQCNDDFESPFSPSYQHLRPSISR